MSVEIFTQADFEKALPKHKLTGDPMCKLYGFVEGELEYYMPIDDCVGIVIRSSIGHSGCSADTGEDSIRAWLVDSKQGKPLGSKVSKYTTRVSGWGERLTTVLRTLYGWRKKAGNCPDCGKPKLIFKVKKAGPNKGKVFAKCEEHNGFTWLED